MWLLNLLPPAEPFRFNRGGYQTINFIPELVTMLFGLMCGELMRSRFSAGKRLLILTGAGLAGIAVGLALDVTGVCPIVKRIWTPSWTLYSTGWCCLIHPLWQGDFASNLPKTCQNALTRRSQPSA